MELKQHHYITEEQVTRTTDAGMVEVQDKTPKQNINAANTSDATPDVSKMLTTMVLTSFLGLRLSPEVKVPSVLVFQF
jgi:hypothetical protein